MGESVCRSCEDFYQPLSTLDIDTAGQEYINGEFSFIDHDILSGIDTTTGYSLTTKTVPLPRVPLLQSMFPERTIGRW